MDRDDLPELSITYLKFGTSLLCSWPLSRRASTADKILFEIRWWFLFILAMSVEAAMFYSLYIQQDNFMELTKFICYAASIGQGSIKMLISRQQYRRFQELIEEMKEFLKNATVYERAVLNSCLRQAAYIHLTCNMSGFIAAFSVVIGPIVLNQTLPTEALYPFDVEKHPLLDIIYVTQSIVAMQCSCVGPVDGQVCILIWFTIARLKLLVGEVKSIKSTRDLNACIRMHQNLLRYIREVTKVGRLFAATTIAMATLSIAFGGVHVIGHEPFSLRVQFIGFDIGYGLQLFLSAWAAEHLLIAMEEVKWALYNSDWVNSTNVMNKSFLFIMQRLNKPPKISMGGIMPELSLKYYAVYLSKTFSFFTTLRIVVMKMDLPVVES